MHKFGRFIVGFSYPDKDVVVDQNGQKTTIRMSTKCIITDSLDNRIVGEAIVRRSSRDRDVRKIGRKIALTKAMENGLMLKEDRREIFLAYDAINALKPKKHHE